MDFVIYSIGSGAYLTEVLLAVSSIMGSGSFVRLMQIGMVLGVLILAFQAVMTGGRQINVGQVALAFLLYALMFGPRVDVAVHGVYDRHNQAVSNVPIGIAAPGAIVSQIGLGLTRMFETAFAPLTSSTAPTGLSQGGGFVDALKVLNTVRRGATDTALLSALDETHPGFRRSWDDYLRNCTSTKILHGLASMEEIYNSPFDENKGMRFDSKTFSTRVFYGDSSTSMSCTDAWGEITNKLDEVTSGSSIEMVMKRLIRPEGTPSGAEMEGTIPATASAEITAALDMLGQSATQAQSYIRLALLEPIFIQAMANRYQDFFDTNTAVMINQALDQRNIQWASEQTVFMSVVRPMITFIEGFAYSIAPFAAFILVLGGFGLKLVTKYSQMLLWIQLWLPVLAMTNMYLHSVASMELAQLDDFGASFYALNQADQRLAHWVGVGGMLAAATPILTLVLLTGSTYAMTNLAGRMNGADHVNEKVASPDAIQPSPVMQQAAMYQHSAGSGRVMSGAEGSLLTFQVGQTRQDALQSARQDLFQASESLTGSMQQSFKAGETLSSNQGRVEMFNSALSSHSNAATDAVTSTANQIANKLDLSSTQSTSLRAEMAASASVGGGAKLGAILDKIGFGGTFTGSEGFSQDQSVADVISSTQGISWSGTHSAQISEALSHQVQGMSSEQLAQSWGSENVRSIQDAAAEVRSSSESYAQTSSLTKSLQNVESLRADRLGQMVGSTPGAAAALASRFNALATPDMKAEANARAARYAADVGQGGYGLSAASALAVAKLEQLQNGGLEHQQAFMGLLGQVTGADQGNMPGADARRNEGLGDGIASPTEKGRGAYGSIPNARNPLGVNGDRDMVEAHYQDAYQGVEDHHTINQAAQAQEAIGNTIDELGSGYTPGGVMSLGTMALDSATSADTNGGGFLNAGRASLGRTSPAFGSREASGLDMLRESLLENPTMTDHRGDVSSFRFRVVSRSLGLSEDHAAAMAYGTMTELQRRDFEAAGGVVNTSSSPALQAAFAAGNAYRDSGGDASAADRAYDAARVEHAASYYRDRYDSEGVATVASVLHTRDTATRQALYETGVRTIAEEAARAEGVDYSSLDANEQHRYHHYAQHVANATLNGLADGRFEGATTPAARHSEVVRLSRQHQ